MTYKGSNTTHNEKPRYLAATKRQGKGNANAYSKNSKLDPQKQRWIKGQELYRYGGVSIGKDGYFHVNGYKVDSEKVSCECPDYIKHKQPCKHFYAVSLWQKNRHKIKIENLSQDEIVSGTGNASTDSNPASNPSPYDRQRTITRLACINSAIEVLKANEEFIELDELLSVARQLEDWVLGK